MKEIYPKRDPFKNQEVDFYKGRFESRVKQRSVVPSVAVGAIAVALFAAIVWYNYPGNVKDDAIEVASVPMIRADNAPTGYAPDEPGGIDVPFQDSIIFSDLEPASGPDGAAGTEELFEVEEAFVVGDTEEIEVTIDGADDLTTAETARLIEEAEALLAESGEFDGLEGEIEIEVEDVTAKAVDGESFEVASAMAQPEPVKEAAEMKTTTAATLRGEVVSAEAATTARPETADKKPAETEKPAEQAEDLSEISPAVGLGDYYVQLGSLTSRDLAEKEWGRLQRVYSSQLKGLDLDIQEANLNKGTYYRVRAGGMSKAEADRTCDAIKAKSPGGCIVVRK